MRHKFLPDGAINPYNYYPQQGAGGTKNICVKI